MTLIDELVVSGAGRIVQLPEAVHGWLAGEFVSRFVADRTKDWWWEALSVEGETQSYGSADGLELISRRSSHWGAGFLLLTDECPNPVGSLIGLVDDLLVAVREVRTFEFVLIRSNFSEWCFDTHANCFIHYTATGSS
jgi:hypothetical protein